MGSVPSFLLRKLYVKGSLRNTDTGFEVTIQNTLAPGTIVALAPLQVDGMEYPLHNIKAVLPDGRQVSAADVSAQAPVRFTIGDKVVIRVEGQPLSVGRHTLTIAPKTMEAGTLDIQAEDVIA
ncbi:MAG: hypothetical protein JSW37_02030 [Anaerolineales bacterium]|jgi:hydroxymethylglutaryl-CoA reductase (NADPH)|nr:MAG: hypothetical protein JSW37_02030 [Anaerolineales bacterium]